MKFILADYVKNFQCDGKICNSRCCQDWQVQVDAETWQKYKNDFDADFLANFETSAENLTVIKTDTQGKCAFLGADFLCKIQKAHGEIFLSAICSSYPRVTYKISDKIFQQSMTLTCPVAAKLILLRNDKIKFIPTENYSARMIVDFTDRIDNAENFLQLQSSAIEILQDRNFSINKRLKKLCKYFGAETFDNFDAENHAKTLIEIFAEMYNAKLTEQNKKFLRESYLKNRSWTSESEIIFENYLVNEFFMRCYPHAFLADDKVNCRIFVTAFKVLQFALILNIIARQSFTAEDLINLICAVSDMLDHSKGGMDAIKNFALRCDDKNFSDLMLED